MGYCIGVDLSTSGCIAITKDDKVIDILKYPKPEYDKSAEKLIDAKIKALELTGKGKTRIKSLKAEKKRLKRRSVRNYKEIYDFLYPYKNDIDACILEEPIRQMGGFATSVDSIASNFTTLGVYTTVFSILEIPYTLYSPTEWHKFFNYEIPKELSQKEKREEIKKQSIQFCKDMFTNAEDFLIRKGCRKEDDNIAESIILSTIKENEEYVED